MVRQHGGIGRVKDFVAAQSYEETQDPEEMDRGIDEPVNHCINICPNRSMEMFPKLTNPRFPIPALIINISLIIRVMIILRSPPNAKKRKRVPGPLIPCLHEPGQLGTDEPLRAPPRRAPPPEWTALARSG